MRSSWRALIRNGVACFPHPNDESDETVAGRRGDAWELEELRTPHNSLRPFPLPFSSGNLSATIHPKGSAGDPMECA